MSARTPRPGHGTGANANLEGIDKTRVAESAPTAEDVAAWLARQVDAVLNAYAAGQLLPCPHVLAPGRHVVALWDRQRLLCLVCADQLRLAGLDDYVCDRCGIVDPDVVAVLGVTPRVYVTAGVCPRCLAGGVS